jgi:hypothetical protein
MEGDSTVKANQLDWKTYQSVYPKYKYYKILPDNAASVIANSAGGQEVNISLPNKVYNLARSYLTYQFVLRDDAQFTAGQFYWIPVDVWPHFRQIVFQSRSPTGYIAQIDELPNYLEIVWNAETKYDEYKTFDTFGLNNVPTGANNGTGWGRMLRPSYVGSANNKRFDNSNASVPFDEPLHLIASAAAGTQAGVADIVLNVQIPLSMIYNSIFSYDKDLFFDEVMVLKLVTASTNKMGWRGTSRDIPTAGAAALNHNVEFQNMALYLAVEEDPFLAEGLMRTKREKGLNMMIPFVYGMKTGLAQSTSQVVYMNMTRSNGLRCKKIYHSVFNTNESANTIFDHSNINNTKVIQYYSDIDGVRRTDFDINCGRNDTDPRAPQSGLDYLIKKESLKGSLILNSDIFYSKWFHVDDFTNIKSPSELPMTPNQNNLLEGLELPEVGQRKWQIQFTTANAGYNHYTFAIFEKQMSVTNQSGIVVR